MLTSRPASNRLAVFLRRALLGIIAFCALTYLYKLIFSTALAIGALMNGAAQ